MQVVSDHGPQFVSDVFSQLCRTLDIHHVKTVPYRPQSNQAERVNRNLVQMISAYVSENHNNWDQFIQHFGYALRTAVHDSTGKTPAELFLGRKVISPLQRLVMVKGEECGYMAQSIEKHVQEARRNLQKSQEQQARYYDLKRRVVEYKEGDMVLVETHPLSSAPKKVVGKFQPKFRGPYKVLEVIRGNLALEDEKGKRFVVNVDQVRLYTPREEEDFAGPSFAGTRPMGSAVENETEKDRPPIRKRERQTTQASSHTTWTATESRRSPLRKRERRDTHPISESSGRTRPEQRREPTKRGEANHSRRRRRTEPDSRHVEQPRGSDVQKIANQRRGEKHERPTPSQSSRPKRRRYQQGTKHPLSVQKEPAAKRFQHYREQKRPLSATTKPVNHKRRRDEMTREPYQTRSHTRARENSRRGERSNHVPTPTRMTNAERQFASWCWDRKKQASESTIANSGSNL